jgi:hypothetical protein
MRGHDYPACKAGEFILISRKHRRLEKMKKAIAGLLAGLYACGAFAQSFTPNAGVTSTELFSTDPGFTISGLGADSSGNVFYIESGNFGGSFDTRLFEATAASNYTTSNLLYSYGGPTSGSFVRVIGSTVYFGENSGGTILSVSAGGGTPTVTGTVQGNYDLAFQGSNAFLSANPTFSDNQVFKLDLSTGATAAVLDTGGDFSGGIAFDAAGNLYYGATAFGSLPGGIYKFTAAQIADALTNHITLSISDGVLVFDDGNNQYLGYGGGNTLYQANSPFGSAATLTSFDLLNLTSRTLGATGDTDFFGATDANASGFYVAVTADFSSGPSAVFLVIPEPGSTALLGLGALGLLAVRKIRRS